MKALEISGLTKSFSSSVKALDDVSFSLAEGQIGALIGPSGSGKTTLLRCIAGLEHADNGSISILSRKVFGAATAISPSERPVGFLFQDYALFPHMTVEANVRFGVSRLERKVQDDRIHRYLSLCSVDQLKQRFPHQLSGGQQQRVALARALAAEPSLLLLDEPFSNVDETLKQQLRLDMAEVIRLCGISALMVVHDVKDAFAVASHIGVLSEGRIHQSGAPEALYDTPATGAVAKVTGEANLIPAEVTSDGFQSVLGNMNVRHGQSTGSQVTLMLRPEDLHLQAGGDWTVDFVLFNGSAQMIRCVNGMHSMDVRASNESSFKKGDLVKVVPSGKQLHWV